MPVNYKRKPLGSKYDHIIPIVREMPEEKLHELIRSNKFLDEFKIAFQSSTGKALTMTRILTSAGRREILGTRYGDGLKMIASGEIGKLQKDSRTYSEVINALEAAEIADPKTGKIDVSAVRECLRKNRIVHMKEIREAK